MLLFIIFKLYLTHNLSPKFQHYNWFKFIVIINNNKQSMVKCCIMYYNYFTITLLLKIWQSCSISTLLTQLLLFNIALDEKLFFHLYICPQYSVIEFILFLPILSLSVDPVFFQLSSSFIIHYFFHELFKVILVGSELLMKMKKKSEKADLKLSIHKTKMMASGPITSWQLDGKTVETVTDYFLGLQNHCIWWLQPWN